VESILTTAIKSIDSPTCVIAIVAIAAMFYIVLRLMKTNEIQATSIDANTKALIELKSLLANFLQFRGGGK
jgi:hypothetical protein